MCAKYAYSYIHQIGRSAKSMHVKNTKKSPIHENADANITCDFGDGDISLLGVAYQTHVYIITSIILRCPNIPVRRVHSILH